MTTPETPAAPRNTEEQLVVRLRSLPRFQMSAGSLDEYTSFVGEEECEHGDWIRASAIDALIVEASCPGCLLSSSTAPARKQSATSARRKCAR